MSILKTSEKKLSKEEWFNYIELWEKSGKPQAQFCEENSISYGLFGYWRTAYLKKKAPPISQDVKKTNSTPINPSIPAFIPVKSANNQPGVIGETIQARYASGLTLSLPLSFPLDKILVLLKGLEQTHGH